jgi:hypothetical protein
MLRGGMRDAGLLPIGVRRETEVQDAFGHGEFGRDRFRGRRSWPWSTAPLHPGQARPRWLVFPVGPCIGTDNPAAGAYHPRAEPRYMDRGCCNRRNREGDMIRPRVGAQRQCVREEGRIRPRDRRLQRGDQARSAEREHASTYTTARWV